jgi:preprotein translocase subunit SecE
MANNNKQGGEMKDTARKQSQNNKNSGKNKGGLISYLKGVRQELRKVVWLTKDELTTDTVVVIACVLFFAVTFWLIDTGFLAALKGILGITLS